jgi:hypothetical protein
LTNEAVRAEIGGAIRRLRASAARMRRVSAQRVPGPRFPATQ